MLVSNNSIPTAVEDNRRPYEKQLALYLILASILLESVAFYSLGANLPLSLNFNETLNWTYEHSSIGAYIFNGTIYISMLIFAVIADAKLGRVKMITIGLPLYLIGFILNTLLAKGPSFICPPSNNNYGNASFIGDERCVYWVLPTILVTGIGIGAVRANMIAFGGDQIQESKVTSRYIDKFIVAVNIGSIITISIGIVIPDGPELFFTLYVVDTSMLITAVLLFIIGWRYYIHVKPYDSVVTNCIPVVINAFQTWRRYRSNRLINDEAEESTRIDEHPSTFLGYAKAPYHGRFNDRIVDDVISLRNALIVPILVLPYWFILYQVFTSFQLQASHMAHAHDTEYILALLLLIEPVTVIIGIFILNMFGYKYLDARNRSLSIATKFIISMYCAFISMCIAGGVELLREHNCHGHKNESSLPVYAHIPQAIVIGIAQLFSLLATFEFSYLVAPRSAQSLFVSLYFFSRSVVSYSAYTVDIVLSKNHIHFSFDCPNVGQYIWRYFTFFFVLAGVQLIFIIIFIVCQRKIRMISLNRQQTERNQFLQHLFTTSVDQQ